MKEQEQLIELKEIYKDASDWLKFAEAKNAALTTFLLFLLTQLIEGSICPELFGSKMAYVMVKCIISVSLVINITSYVPFFSRLKPISYMTQKYCERLCRGGKENIVFYLDVARKQDDELVAALDILEDHKENKLIESYAMQCVQTSKVAASKLLLFDSVIAIHILGSIVVIGIELCTYMGKIWG